MKTTRLVRPPSIDKYEVAVLLNVRLRVPAAE